MRRLDPVKSATIDMVEASYDLDGPDDEWFAMVLHAGREVIDQGCGYIGLIFDRPPEGGALTAKHWISEGAPEDAPARFLQSFGAMGWQHARAATSPGAVHTATEYGAAHPGLFETWQSELGFAADALGVSAVDPCGRGLLLAVPLPHRSRLTEGERSHWQMLCAHLAAAHRIRRAVAGQRAAKSKLPHNAEAVLDPKTFCIEDASGLPDDGSAAEKLRNAAVRIDRARGRLRNDAPDDALETWWAMMHGRWSMIDWFDSDQRRYVLAIPNQPNLGDPRGLTERELQVATYSALGETGKLISYRLGVSKGTVSNALHAAMHKLEVKTQPQLAEKMRGFATHFGEATKDEAN